MMLKTGGELHYYINGLDQGVAATNVPPPVWSVVDLYGMTVKVSSAVRKFLREEKRYIGTYRGLILLLFINIFSVN